MKWIIILLLLMIPIAEGISRSKSYNSLAGDGYVMNKVNGGGLLWFVCRGASSGSSSSFTSSKGDVKAEILLSMLGSSCSISRLFYPFDLSTVPKIVNYDIATLRTYTRSKSNRDNDGLDYIGVVETTQEYSNNLSKADYNQVGSINLANRHDLGDINVSAYVTWTFNETGKTVIRNSFAGDLKIGLREGHDLENNAISGTATNSMSSYLSEFSAARFTIKEYSAPQMI